MDTLERVKRIVADELQLDLKSIPPDAEIQADLGADSLHMVAITMAAEEEFGTRLPEEEVMGLKTCRQMAEYVELKAPGEQRENRLINA